MLDTYRIERRIQEIHKRLRFINKEYKPLTKEELTSSKLLNDSAERNIQVAVQACLDIANHIVAALGLDRSFNDTSEVFFELSQEKIIPESLAEKLIKAVGYRNVIVHDYLEVDSNQTYLNIQNNMGDLAEFAKYIAEFLEKTKKTSK